MKILLLLVACLASLAHAQLPVTVALGVPVSVSKNVKTKINLLPGGTLDIIAFADVQVTVSAYVNLDVGLPKGFQALGFTVGAQVGFRVDIGPESGVEFDANFTTPSLGLDSLPLLGELTKPAAVLYDNVTKTFSYLKIRQFNGLLLNNIVIPIPKRGIYLFVAVNLNATLPSFFSTPQILDANAGVKFAFPDGLELNVTVNSNSSLSVASLNQSSFAHDGRVSLGNKYYDINLNSTNLNKTLQAILTYRYNQSTVDALNIKEEDLRFAFLNETTGMWQTPSTGGAVDVINNTVTQITNHFSQWSILAPQQQISLPIALGVPVAVPANTNFTIEYIGGGSLQIVVDANANVTLAAYVNAELNLPKGFASLSLGLQLTVVPSTVRILSATLVTPAIGVDIADILTGSVQAGALRYDIPNQYFSFVLPSYDSGTRTITLKLPDRGVYLFVAVQLSSVILPAVFAQAQAIPAATQVTYSYPDGLNLNLTVNRDSSLVVNANVQPKNPIANAGGLPLGKFFDINLDSLSTVNRTLQATLVYLYNQSMIDAMGINEDSLRFAFFNETAARWQTQIGGLVDTVNNRVTQTTNHFSEWAIFADASVIGTLGVAIPVPGNTNFTIRFLTGGSLNIVLSGAANVTLSPYIDVETQLPSGFQALQFTAGVGFRFDVSPSTVSVISASLTTPSLSLEAAALLTGSASVACLRYDTSSRAYSNVDIPAYNALNRSITLTLPDRGIYIFVVAQANVTLPSFFEQPQTVAANEEVKFAYPGGLELNLSVDSDATLTVVKSNQSSVNVNFDGRVSLGVFFDFTLDTSGSGANLQATIVYQYDQALIDSLGVDESTLRFGFFNEATGAWEVPSAGGSVDTQNNIVRQQTTHFSEWSVYATNSTTPTGDQESSQSSASAIFVSMTAFFAALVPLFLL